MTTVFLAPIVDKTFLIPGGNTPGTGVKLFCYAAGTSTKQNMYTSSSGAVAWSNPIVLDSGGNLAGSGEIWIPQGLPAKFVYAPSNDTDPPVSPYAGQTYDAVTGINDITTSGLEWIAGTTPTFINGTSFSIAGDQTLTYTPGRRLKTTNTGGTVYCTILTSVFSTLTTITVQNDSAALDSGLTAVQYGQLSSVNGSMPWTKQTSTGPVMYGPITMSSAAINESQGSDIASASSINLDTATGNLIDISGTTAIAQFVLSPGRERTLRFTSTVPLANSSTLVLPGGANITTAPGDYTIVRGYAAGVVRGVVYVRGATGATAAKQPTIQDFTSGSGTYTTPAGVTRIVVRMVGAGAGGGGQAATGGGAGGNTTFGASLTAGGGAPGSGGAAGVGGAGGTNTVSGTTISFPGASGQGGGTSATGGVASQGGNGGGSSFYGGGGGGGAAQGAAGSNGATNTGGGGGGGSAVSAGSSAGGGGGGGSVEAWISPPAATYSYNIPAGGGGGAGSQTNGGNGAAGRITVYEYYD